MLQMHKVGSMLGNTTGVCIRPVIIPTIAVGAIPINIAPGTLKAYNITVAIIPNIVNKTGPSVICPNVTNVESLFTIIPELCKPTKL